MAKSSGLAITTLSVGDATNAAQDVRDDITNFQLSTPRAVQDVTGIDKSAIERLALLADASLQLNGVFDPAANAAHAVFATVPSTSVNRAVLLTMNGKNLNLGSAGAGTGAVLFTDYQVTRAASGELTWQAPGVLANGVVPTWS